MGTFWSKLDAGLATLYTNWLEIEQKGRSGVGWVHPGLRRRVTGAHVRLRFDGPLADIERAGFETKWVRDDDRVASGIVRFATLDAVASVPGVIRLSYGRSGRPTLVRSIPYVHADHVRHYSDSTHDYVGFAGRNVVVAVIDTGLDYTHDFLQDPRASDSDPHRTRILRIWDQGLVPISGEHSPNSTLLSGRPTYGVEYTEADINATLNETAGTRVRHRDCSGHGTHVASTAAGTGGRARSYVGMAPLAKLIGVKILYLETEPQQGGAVMSYDQRFADAVDWIYAVAATPELGNPRVVINYSVGDDLGPHDGLTQSEEDLNHTLAADPRRVFVVAAGNEGGGGRKSRITVPSGATSVTIPFVLVEGRVESQMTSYNHCSVRPTADTVELEIWYPAPSPAAVTGTLQIEGLSGTIAIPDLGLHTQPVTFGEGQTHKLTHDQDLGEVGSTRVLRNVIRLEIAPAANRYQTVDVRKYTFQLSVTAGQVFDVFGGSSAHGAVKFRIDYDNPVTNSFTTTCEITLPASASGTLAVGNYEIPTTPGPDDLLSIGTQSSHGPLVQYSSAFTPPAKPEIGAPGEDITAAASRFTVRPGCCVTLPRHDATRSMSGTSMASPHVAGLIALMLEKNPTLTFADIRASLRTLSGLTIDPLELGAGVIDAEATLNATPAAP
jgi:subtilisin family serine protease